MLMSLLGSCGFTSGPKEEATVSRPSDELDFAVDSLDSQATTEMKVKEQKIIEQTMPDQIAPIVGAGKADLKDVEMKAPEEPKFSDYKKDTAPTNLPVVTRDESFEPKLGSEAQYHIQKGETLMMAAFKIYGDYRKWKDLSSWNKGKKVSEGSVIKYYVPEKPFGWKPNGMPYLVKSGDTLQVISKDKYGTINQWKSIYENNRPLIQNPNLIFAGFTIYYVPTRDVASQER
jgi:nucleoid-associated protein YgaU